MSEMTKRMILDIAHLRALTRLNGVRKVYSEQFRGEENGDGDNSGRPEDAGVGDGGVSQEVRNDPGTNHAIQQGKQNPQVGAEYTSTE